MSTIDSLHFTAAVSCLDLILIWILWHGNKITHAVNVTIHCFFFFISEELITWEEVAYPLEKQFTPKNKTKKKKEKKKKAVSENKD